MEQNDVQYSITQDPGRRVPENGRASSIYTDPGDLKMARIRTKDVEFAEDGQEMREDDFKKKQVFSGGVLMWLAYQSTGVIYGDIGTSPLYVYSSTFTSEPSYVDLLGVLSLIIWSVTLIVTVKYVLIVLCADDQGEGGTFAMYSLLARYSNISEHDPKMKHTIKLERYKTTDMKPSNHSVRSFLERSAAARVLLKALSVFGVSLILADGILTPAQSVLGAIQGLRVAKEDISTSTIIGVSCTILVLLFLVQPFGIHRVGTAFAPVVMVWLLLNLSFGIYNLIQYDYTVLKAFSPYFAGNFLMRNKKEGWIALGGILLAFTGVEALFADLGAFSKKAIQISWLCLAYPCLLLAYAGQAAYISHDPSAYANPFFRTVPHGMFYPSLVISILAAIVASQAMITSSFQLLSQVMNMSYFPQIKMIYTSDKFHGQVYIPMANWLLMIGTVIVTAVYNNTTRLGHAYGVCVILVTFITTNIIAIVAIVVWRSNWILVVAIWLPFITLDGLFLSSALTKVPDGAWFTLLLAVLLATFFILWRYGKENQWRSEAKDRPRLHHLVTKGADGKHRLAEAFGGRELTTIKGLGIFFDKAGEMVPMVYQEFLLKFEAQQEVHVFLHLRALSKPHVSEEERYAVSRTTLANCYRITIRHGYNDRVISADLGDIVYQELRHAIMAFPAMPALSTQDSEGTPPASSAVSTSIEHVASSQDSSSSYKLQFSVPNDASVERRLAKLDTAYKRQVVYIVGKEQLRLLSENNNFVKRLVLYVFVWLRENTRAKISQMEVPIEKLVEVGFVKDM